MLDIDTPSAQLNQAWALDVNESGEVVGAARPFFSAPKRAHRPASSSTLNVCMPDARNRSRGGSAGARA